MCEFGKASLLCLHPSCCRCIDLAALDLSLAVDPPLQHLAGRVLSLSVDEHEACMPRLGRESGLGFAFL